MLSLVAACLCTALEGLAHHARRFPIGGESISVTSGVVSRIEVTSYVHGAAELLGVQIDAAINSGNSGGPAFNNRGQCVGIAFQSLKAGPAPSFLELTISHC